MNLNKVIYELAMFTLEIGDYQEYNDPKTRNNIEKDFKNTLKIN